ncbi:MAG: ATP-binding protein [Pseudomonadota bacterium]
MIERGSQTDPRNLEQLKARLEEAEETLRAIRNGEVDALLIGGEHGDRVYTVSTADEPYRLLVEQMREGAATLSATGSVLYCNPCFAAMMRTTPDRIIAKDMLSFIAPNDRSGFVELLEQGAASAGRRELVLQASDETRIPVHMSANALKLRDMPCVCLVITDLTEQRNMAEALRQSQKVEAVGQLTSGVAHDFNNLLTAVLGNLEVMQTRIKDADLLKLLQGALRGAQRGARLTEQLLAFSRKQHLRIKPVSVNQVVTGMSDLLRSTIGGIVRVECVLKPDLWPALIDPNQIELAILNLAINGRDAMPLGGTLTIETSNLQLGARAFPGAPAPGEYVSVQISDTGTGMSPDVQAQVFEPFFTTKEPGKGSGLGLSMVQGVISQLGGGVRLRSRLGEGTTVTLFLPRAELAAPARAPAAPLDVRNATDSGTILLVDDDPDVREITRTLLESFGYAVIEAASGRVALEVIDTDRDIDLLLADYAMPGMNASRWCAWPARSGPSFRCCSPPAMPTRARSPTTSMTTSSSRSPIAWPSSAPRSAA